MEHSFGAYFISGVDTNCGKTYVTSNLASYIHHRGVSVITQKPIQTGCEVVADDLIEHRRAMGTGLLPEDKEGRTCSYLFKTAATPQLAATLEGRAVDVEKIDRDTRFLLSRYHMVLVEGVGGLMVPLNDEYLTIDYVASRRLPLILVVTSRFGGINHAFMSIEACKNHDVDLRVIVYNRFPDDDRTVADENFTTIKKFALSLFPHITMVDFRSSDSFWGLEL